jgi:hypothetical protein
VVSVAPAAGTAVVGVPHEGVPPAVGDAEVAVGGDDAPTAPLAPVPAVAPLVAPPVHGWVTGGVAGVGVGVGVGVADVGGGFVVVVVPAGGEAPAVGGLVFVDAGVGVVGGVVVAGGGAGGVVAVVGVVTGADAADVVPVAAPTPAVADAATHRLATTTASALTVTASRCFPNPATIASVLKRMRWSPIRYLSRTVRVTVCRCPAPSSAAIRRTSVPTLMPFSRRVGRWSLITLCGLVICDSVS